MATTRRFGPGRRPWPPTQWFGPDVRLRGAAPSEIARATGTAYSHQRLSPLSGCCLSTRAAGGPAARCRLCARTWIEPPSCRRSGLEAAEEALATVRNRVSRGFGRSWRPRFFRPRRRSGGSRPESPSPTTRSWGRRRRDWHFGIAGSFRGLAQGGCCSGSPRHSRTRPPPRPTKCVTVVPGEGRDFPAHVQHARAGRLRPWAASQGGDHAPHPTALRTHGAGAAYTCRRESVL